MNKFPPLNITEGTTSWGTRWEEVTIKAEGLTCNRELTHASDMNLLIVTTATLLASCSSAKLGGGHGNAGRSFGGGAAFAGGHGPSGIVSTGYLTPATGGHGVPGATGIHHGGPEVTGHGPAIPVGGHVGSAVHQSPAVGHVGGQVHASGFASGSPVGGQPVIPGAVDIRYSGPGAQHNALAGIGPDEAALIIKGSFDFGHDDIKSSHSASGAFHGAHAGGFGGASDHESSEEDHESDIVVGSEYSGPVGGHFNENPAGEEHSLLGGAIGSGHALSGGHVAVGHALIGGIGGGHAVSGGQFGGGHAVSGGHIGSGHAVSGGQVAVGHALTGGIGGGHAVSGGQFGGGHAVSGGQFGGGHAISGGQFGGGHAVSGGQVAVGHPLTGGIGGHAVSGGQVAGGSIAGAYAASGGQIGGEHAVSGGQFGGGHAVSGGHVAVGHALTGDNGGGHAVSGGQFGGGHAVSAGQIDSVTVSHAGGGHAVPGPVLSGGSIAGGHVLSEGAIGGGYSTGSSFGDTHASSGSSVGVAVSTNGIANGFDIRGSSLPGTPLDAKFHTVTALRPSGGDAFGTSHGAPADIHSAGGLHGGHGDEHSIQHNVGAAFEGASYSGPAADRTPQFANLHSFGGGHVAKGNAASVVSLGHQGSIVDDHTAPLTVGHGSSVVGSHAATVVAGHKPSAGVGRGPFLGSPVKGPANRHGALGGHHGGATATVSFNFGAPLSKQPLLPKGSHAGIGIDGSGGVRSSHSGSVGGYA
ncbi:glycine-rich cell wall structural protein 1.8-like [Penaeus monodon]|uniref:glycine-rich cell wall structural protein 1.8-like n=1 Tax=Penaeus monodon TaxID=6687 RepID=UPI0018A74551|nr:glycine-rich cell wall structural protein 1.8-like [Penaeus monodon]